MLHFCLPDASFPWQGSVSLCLSNSSLFAMWPVQLLFLAFSKTPVLSLAVHPQTFHFAYCRVSHWWPSPSSSFQDIVSVFDPMLKRAARHRCSCPAVDRFDLIPHVFVLLWCSAGCEEKNNLFSTCSHYSFLFLPEWECIWQGLFPFS